MGAAFAGSHDSRAHSLTFPTPSNVGSADDFRLRQPLR